MAPVQAEVVACLAVEESQKEAEEEGQARGGAEGEQLASFVVVVAGAVAVAELPIPYSPSPYKKFTK